MGLSYVVAGDRDMGGYGVWGMGYGVWVGLDEVERCELCEVLERERERGRERESCR